MGVRQTVFSDLSGQDIPDDDQHARVVIKDHPALSGSAVELDITTDEASQLQTTKIDLVTMTVYEPNQSPRHAVLDADSLGKPFKGVNFEQLLAGARRATQEPTQRRGRGGRGGGGGKAASTKTGRTDRVDYTDPEHMGELHRGRVTEEEARMVRDNPEQASKNRERQTGSPIDFDDPREKRRYGL